MAALFVFYRGYRGLALEFDWIRSYYVCQALLGAVWFIFSIVDAGSFNGFMKSERLFQENYGFQGFLSVVESIGYLLNSIFSYFCIYKVR